MAFVDPDEIGKPQTRGFVDPDAVGSATPKLGNMASQVPNDVVPPIPTPAPTWIDKLKGAGEAGLAAVTGAAGGLAGNVAGVARTLTSGLDLGTPEGVRQGQQRAQEVASNLTYQPRTTTGKEYTGTLSNILNESKLAGLGPSEAIPAGILAGPAVAQAKQGIRTAAAPVVNAIAQSPEADLVRRGATALVPKPNVSPEVGRLAIRANKDFDIPLRPDMLTDNRFARIIGDSLENVPLSGSKDERRQIAFNRAVGQTVGADRLANKLTPDVFDGAMTRSGEGIGAIAERTPIPLSRDPELTAALTQHELQANRFEVGDVSKIISNYVDELRTKAAPTGVIPGETFKKINSDIGRKIRSTSNGDLKNALSDLQDTMQDALERHIASPEDLKSYLDYRKQYAIGKTIEPLIAKSPEGNISPASLMAAVTATKDKKSMMARGRGGDIGDLAKIGQLFLKEPRSSFTTERGAVYGVLGGAGMVSPPVAAGVYAGANAYNRIGPMLTEGMLSRLQKELGQ